MSDDDYDLPSLGKDVGEWVSVPKAEWELIEAVLDAAKAFAYGGGTDAWRTGFTWQHVKALGAAVDALSTSQRDRQEASDA
jgi:hypothetical protein